MSGKYLMMMVSKIGITINFAMDAAGILGILGAPATGGSSLSALLPIIFGGGIGSAALAYGMKTTGGGL
jgi:hypothetical protein